MSDTPAARGAPPPTADPQDPLPESNWFWRRTFIFLVLASLLAGAWFKVDIVGQVALRNGQTSPDAILGLISIIKWALALSGILMLFYLVSPSAEQVVKMLATLSAWRAGVSTTSTSRATAPDGSMAEATTSAGKAPGIAPPATTPSPEVDAAPTKAKP